MANIIEMPKLSDTMSSGTLIAWLKKEGDAVSTGDMIAEVETDKATMEVEAFEDGVMLKHYVNEGDQVEIGGPICAIGDKGEEAPKVEAPGKAEGGSADDEESEKEEKEESEDTKSEASREESEDSDEKSGDVKEETPKKSDDEGRIKASPLARKIAADRGIDLKSVQGTGPGGRIVKADVEKAEKTPAKSAQEGKKTSAPAPVATGAALGEDQELPVSNIRATIARALVASKQESPHFYLQMEVDAAPLTRFRQELNAKLAELPPEQGGAKFSVNDLILKASAEAVRRVPAINRSWQKGKMIQYGSVHLAFAVAIDDGLVTPIIRNAETKTLRAISQEARELAQKAKNRKLKPDEMQNSTLTVSNLGMFGISDFYGIINPPNAAILSIGTAVKTPVFDKNDQVVVGYRMKIGLSGDHRAIDGAVGALYLQALRDLLETPGTMLV